MAQTISCCRQTRLLQRRRVIPLSARSGGVLVGNIVQNDHFTCPAHAVCRGFRRMSADHCGGQVSARSAVHRCPRALAMAMQTASMMPVTRVHPRSATPTGCTTTCPPPTTPNEQCLPQTGGCNPNQAGSCGVLTCECQDPNSCHLVHDTAGYHCEGGCPVPPGGTCTLLGDGHFDNPLRRDCVGTPGCVPNADASDCEQSICPGPVPPTDTCHKKCVKMNAFGNIEVTDCDCEPTNNCHVETHQGPVPCRGSESGGVAGGGNGCIVPDDGGTVDLPPVGCDYLSPDDVHMIISRTAAQHGNPSGPDPHQFHLSQSTWRLLGVQLPAWCGV